MLPSKSILSKDEKIVIFYDKLGVRTYFKTLQTVEHTHVGDAIWTLDINEAWKTINIMNLTDMLLSLGASYVGTLPRPLLSLGVVVQKEWQLTSQLFLS